MLALDIQLQVWNKADCRRGSDVFSHHSDRTC